MKTPPSDLPPIPEGFDYYGEGPIKSVVPYMSRDILRFDEEERKWIDLNYGNGGHHYALRSGSPVALANGLVPPAPAEEPMHPDPRHERFREMFRAAHPNPDYTAPMPTTEAAAARTLVEAMAGQIRELKGERDVLALWKEGSLRMFRKWDRIDAHVRNHKDAVIGDSVVDKALEWLEERDELLGIRERMTHQIGALRTELAATRMANDMAATSYNEARIERDDAVRELARVREMLRNFYAAAEAMAKEGAK